MICYALPCVTFSCLSPVVVSSSAASDKIRLGFHVFTGLVSFKDNYPNHLDYESVVSLENFLLVVGGAPS